MRRRRGQWIWLVVGLMVAGSVWARTWTHKGKAVQGELISTDGDIVIIELDSGGRLIALTRDLSDADLRYLRNPDSETAAPREAAPERRFVDPERVEREEPGGDPGLELFDAAPPSPDSRRDGRPGVTLDGGDLNEGEEPPGRGPLILPEFGGSEDGSVWDRWRDYDPREREMPYMVGFIIGFVVVNFGIFAISLQLSCRFLRADVPGFWASVGMAGLSLVLGVVTKLLSRFVLGDEAMEWVISLSGVLVANWLIFVSFLDERAGRTIAITFVHFLLAIVFAVLFILLLLGLAAAMIVYA